MKRVQQFIFILFLVILLTLFGTLVTKSRACASTVCTQNLTCLLPLDSNKKACLFPSPSIEISEIATPSAIISEVPSQIISAIETPTPKVGVSSTPTEIPNGVGNTAAPVANLTPTPTLFSQPTLIPQVGWK